MKKFFLFFCTILFFKLFCQPSYGVYLEYNDDMVTGARTITINFTPDNTVIDLFGRDGRTIEERKEGARRVKCLLDGTALSFTEEKTIQKNNAGSFSYQRQELDFFNSEKALTFIEWIEKAKQLKALRFIGVETDQDVLAIKRAFEFINKQRCLNFEIDEFVEIERGDEIEEAFEEEEADQILPKRQKTFWDRFKKKKNSCILLESVPPKEEESLQNDLLRKFLNASITCRGSKSTEGLQVIKDAVTSWPSKIKEALTISAL